MNAMENQGRIQCLVMRPGDLGLFVIVLLLAMTGPAFGRQQNQEQPKPIEDNSFLVEEAYNQEEGVVQHIFGAGYFSHPVTELSSSFTQEWPIFSVTHQFSFTIPYEVVSSRGGIGDVRMNYRYQAFGKEDWAAAAPRLSLILATGSRSEGFGSGTTGFELAIPVSKRIADSWVVHANAVCSVFPGVRQSGGVTRTVTSTAFGGSVIWLTGELFNALLEVMRSSGEEIAPDGTVTRSPSVVLNPGVRFAVNVGSLQIVPGLGFPIEWSEGKSRLGAFVYLSFEHPFVSQQ